MKARTKAKRTATQEERVAMQDAQARAHARKLTRRIEHTDGEYRGFLEACREDVIRAGEQQIARSYAEWQKQEGEAS